MWLILITLFAIIIFSISHTTTDDVTNINVVPDLVESKTTYCNNKDECALGFICRSGECVKLPDDFNHAKSLKCNEKHGLFSILSATTFITEPFWQCRSMFNHLWSDDDRLQPGVCEGGLLDTNVLDHQPTINDCHCPPGTTLMSNNDGVIPLCIDNKLVNFYSNYVIY